MNLMFLDTEQYSSDPSEMEDEKILALSVESPDFFSILIKRYEVAFLRKARSILGNREEVKDVVQETFTKIYLNAGKFQVQEGAKFSSWAYKILINTTLTQYQKLKKIRGGEASFDDEIWQLIPDASKSDLEKLEVRDMVARVISHMPEPLAKVLTLYFIKGLSQKEIAEQENTTVSAIKTRVHRAKKEFKRLSVKII